MPSWKFADWFARPANRVAIVGASGWIGMALVDQVLSVLADVPGDRLRLFGSRSRALSIGDRELRVEALSPESSLGDGQWLILHAGIVGGDRVEGGNLDEVRRRNDSLLDHVLALSRSGAADRLVFFSSGAAGRPEVGGLAKQAYARMKLAHEATVATWGLATETPVLMPRVFNLGGAFINHTRAYALGDFILQYAQTGRIRIGSDSAVRRDFVHVRDMVRGVLHMAVDPQQTGAPFDISLMKTIELDDLARAVIKAIGGASTIERQAGRTGDNDDYGGDGERFQKALQQSGGAPASLDEIVADTVAYLRRTGEIPPVAA